MRFLISRSVAFAIVVSLVVAIMAAATNAAAAAITSTQLTAAAPAFSGSCPVTMTFTGKITGAPGTTFRYGFNRVTNGVQQVQDMGATSIPAGGTLPVNDSFSINATTGANTFDQIYVHNIPGQPDVYSNKANYSVTCAPGGPPPNPAGGLTGMHRGSGLVTPDDLAHNPAAPTNITTSNDPLACNQHMANPFIAGLLCQPLASGGLFILWNWQPHTSCTACPQDVDGFRVYETDTIGLSAHRVTETSEGAAATVSVLSSPAGGFNGKCYAVSAYKGNQESTLGQRTCIGSAPRIGTVTATLKPSHMRESMQIKAAGTGILEPLDPLPYYCTGGIEHGGSSYLTIGFQFESSEHFTGDLYCNKIQRGGVMFDLGSLVGRPLQRAVLRLHVHYSSVGPLNDPYRRYASTSCVAELGVGKPGWWSSGGWIEAADWIGNPQRSGPNVNIDVTGVVRNWMNGADNNGFVLRGPSEDLGAFTNDTCFTFFDDETLTVEHF